MKIFQYLSSLNQEDLDQLYKDNWTCQAILRSLPPIGKQFILKLLMIDSIEFEQTKIWTQEISNQVHRETFKKLFDLKLLTKNKTCIQLNSIFQHNIKQSLMDMEHRVFSSDTTVKELKAPTIDELDQFSKTQWEKVLYLLSDEKSDSIPLISELLQSSNLTSRDGNGQLAITSEGFKFLLKDIYTQIWTLLIVYLDTIEKKYKSRIELLCFLFKLSFLQLGRGYLVSELTQLQKTLLTDLKQFGLIYIKSNDNPYFYPTRLIISLTTGKTLSLMQDIKTEQALSQKEQGYIILETNYRLYAYTSSSLQISLLSLFVKMLYRLPNLAVGIVTRESIRMALIHGITADQIIDFIRHNAHPNATLAGTPIPDVVAEQVKLWEAERNCVDYSKAVLYNSFPTLDCFNATVKYAKELNLFIYSNDSKKILVIDESGNEPIRNYIRKNFG
ncbi:general transcription factor IIH [Tieghemostelium lacteum]|uniref:General transcription factor IIH subunit 4 n=1 Tax=Tieghemostelium lacteum TaxID=361077 RepID=A0A151ZAK4_TIELA|nr:general transcription factor IIH [Tieghemostelium lacteum]|eukprot:KYQ90924.1 general transcription factor IIH [Tieghemostelium lacteum]